MQTKPKPKSKAPAKPAAKKTPAKSGVYYVRKKDGNKKVLVA